MQQTIKESQLVVDNWQRIPNDEIFLFIRSPTRIVYAVVAYLMVIAALKAIMRNRQPYVLFTPIRVYNLLLVAINTYMTWTLFNLADKGRDFFRCHPAKFDNLHTIARLLDCFLLTRVLEFLDTVFFALRKKDNQISFLHVFHHAYVPITGIYMIYDLTSPLIMIPVLINSFIHVIMYTYYSLATFKSLQEYLWWKRYLTGLQMVQFVMMITFSGYQLLFNRHCPYQPHKILYFTVITGSIFLALFLNFYIQSYSKKGDSAKKQN